MLTREMNQRLTQVGPGTPMGELMRRYWHPIATSKELEKERMGAIAGGMGIPGMPGLPGFG